jgi:Tol biopolymer transport system component
LEGRILFTRAGGEYGDETVFTANADGTNVKQITPFGATCCPRWSPDGRHILIAASAPDGRITTGIIEPDGSNERTIPLPPGTLNLGCAQAFSPVTGQLACDGWSDEDPDAGGIYLVDGVDGSEVFRVTHSPEGEEERAAGFLPSGSAILFFRSDERMPNPIDESVGSLFVVNTDGTGLQRVTPRDMPVQVTGAASGRLSTDGEWVVFSSTGTIWKVIRTGQD